MSNKSQPLLVNACTLLSSSPPHRPVRELRDQVAELQSNNDYAMRMKDIAFQEQLKKITER